MMDGILKQVLEDNPGFLAVWTCWEPNALDGKDSDFADAFGHDETGRYLPYWNRLTGDIDVEPLVDYNDPEKGAYYQRSLKTKEEEIFEPIPFTVDEKTQFKTVLTIPVLFGGKAVAVVGVDIPLASFRPIVKGVRLYETGYGFLVSSGGILVAHGTDPQYENKSLSKLGFEPQGSRGC